MANFPSGERYLVRSPANVTQVKAPKYNAQNIAFIVDQRRGNPRGVTLNERNRGNDEWCRPRHRARSYHFVIAVWRAKHASPRGGFLFRAALWFSELTRVLVRFDNVASFTRSAAKLEGLSQQLKLNKAILLKDNCP
ncbi:MAG: hypothetical protein DME98_08250 [Verrucomicrobia bacterium]|nr:MAG: hypothetical protein DME98_08250 [Verrucomicrobiota bacterium]PYJ35957.1 MAG: hypothetical protein DME88_00210 [Verrucomicrobiota bacterium]